MGSLQRLGPLAPGKRSSQQLPASHSRIAAAAAGRYAGFQGEVGVSMSRKPAAVEAVARAINAEPWEPMAGMVKRQCPRCRYFFASAIDSAERRCADYASLGTGAPRSRAVP